MRLLAPSGDVRAQKALVTAAFAGVNVETPKFTIGVDDKTADFLQRSPLGRIPVLITSDGTSIFESNAIARYLARIRQDSCLYGKSFTESGQVDMWIDFITYELEVPLCCLLQSNNNDDKKQAIPRALADITNALKVIEKHLSSRTFMVGEYLTLADICLSVILSHGVNNYKVGKLSKSIILPEQLNIQRFFDTITQQPQMKKVVGGCKTNKKAKATSVSEKDDIEKKEEPKIENPLDLLPPTTLDLNEWKRCYSNSKDLYGKAMPWFWNNYDSQGWSFWYMKYEKLEDECKVSFVTSNQLSGFLQRIEPKFRNYSFGVINVVGKDNNFDILGVWMIRGKELPFEVKDHVSFDVHTWKKLDFTKAEDKKLIEDYWCADEEVEGRPVADSKVWK